MNGLLSTVLSRIPWTATAQSDLEMAGLFALRFLYRVALAAHGGRPRRTARQNRTAQPHQRPQLRCGDRPFSHALLGVGPRGAPSRSCGGLSPRRAQCRPPRSRIRTRYPWATIRKLDHGRPSHGRNPTANRATYTPPGSRPLPRAAGDLADAPQKNCLLGVAAARVRRDIAPSAVTPVPARVGRAPAGLE